MKLQTSSEIEAIIADHEAQLNGRFEPQIFEPPVKDMVEAIWVMKERLRMARIEEKLDELLGLARITQK